MDLTRFNFLSLYGNFLCVWFIWCCWSYPLPMLLPEAKKGVLPDSGCLTVREKSLKPEVIKEAWPGSFCAGIPLLTIPKCNVSRQERGISGPWDKKTHGIPSPGSWLWLNCSRFCSLTSLSVLGASQAWKGMRTFPLITC